MNFDGRGLALRAGVSCDSVECSLSTGVFRDPLLVADLLRVGFTLPRLSDDSCRKGYDAVIIAQLLPDFNNRLLEPGQTHDVGDA